MTEEKQVRRYDGVSFDVTLKRGTGTRDQDELGAKVHGENMEEATERLDVAVNELKERAPELREVQPDAGDESQ